MERARAGASEPSRFGEREAQTRLVPMTLLRMSTRRGDAEARITAAARTALRSMSVIAEFSPPPTD